MQNIDNIFLPKLKKLFHGEDQTVGLLDQYQIVQRAMEEELSSAGTRDINTNRQEDLSRYKLLTNLLSRFHDTCTQNLYSAAVQFGSDAADYLIIKESTYMVNKILTELQLSGQIPPCPSQSKDPSPRNIASVTVHKSNRHIGKGGCVTL